MKKIIIVFVNNGMAELDWIMPIIQKFSKKYYIFTFFRNKKSFESLKKNKNLFELWKESNNSYFIEGKFNNFSFKLFKKFFNLFKVKKLDGFFNTKIHDNDYLRKIIKKKINKEFFLEMIFSDFGEKFSTLDNLRSFNYNGKKPLIVNYPHTPMAYFNKKNKRPIALQGDILILARDGDKKYFSNCINKSKIRIVGTPRYDDWWLKKILKENPDTYDLNFDTKELKKKFVITYALKFDTRNSKNDIQLLKNQIFQLMNIVKNIKNSFIIFKLHPRVYLENFEEILNHYDKDIWQVTNMHLIKLASLSDCFINDPPSAACYDVLRLNVPSLQMWNIKKSHHVIDPVIKQKLAVNLKNPEDLKKFLFKSQKKNDNLWKFQQKRFKKFCPYLNFSSDKVIKMINYELKKRAKLNI